MSRRPIKLYHGLVLLYMGTLIKFLVRKIEAVEEQAKAFLFCILAVYMPI
jgi:hypothetical protein